MADHLRRQGARLREARKALKISQEEAARLIGVSNKAYGAWERGTSEPRDRNWRQIEEILKIRVEEIRGEPPQSQLDKIEANQRQILANQRQILVEIASMRDERAAAEARIATQLRSIARTLGIGAKASRKRAGG
jgi:transcriptional regulator with XRE-family HTH domain